jgi:16S rRNA (guanine527-N7)-methyltransferase
VLAVNAGREITDPGLTEVLRESQRLGFLGSRPIEEVIAHARHFVQAVEPILGAADARILDLGAGGGVPGLVIAHDLPLHRVTMLDRRRTRTDFLDRVVRRLEWSGRVDVLTQDAAQLTPGQASSRDAVVARGFGPPQTTLGIAAGWVRSGGVIVISEPPVERGAQRQDADAGNDRWSAVDLTRFGVARCASAPQVSVFRRV